ncbi:hypothetical protein [Persicitalea sp.]|uniref:hypothetical protein n=1 Tax=Persicitalea sp. TaxID=3100273 RepID=UPI003593489E
MKTNRFEEILRRKLESLKPDFQEQDWNKFQSFQQHAAPSFWQTYGHWLGYAVAVLTTATVAILYVSQSRQNDALLREMHALREQVVARGEASAGDEGEVKTGEMSASYPDTVYVIESRVVYRDPIVHESTATRPDLIESSENAALDLGKDSDERNVEKSKDLAASSSVRQDSTERLPRELAINADQSRKEEDFIGGNTTVQPLKSRQPISIETAPGDASPTAMPAPTNNQTLDRRLVLDNIQPLPTPTLPETSRTKYRLLTNRVPKAIRKLDVPMVAKLENVEKSNSALPEVVSTEKTEKTTKEESLLPKFGLNLPFRVGAGQQWEGRTRAFSLWNEALLGEHWSVQAGLSWQKLEDQKFFDELIFKKKMRSDFRKDHAGKLPPSFDIFNISTSTKLIRIPLNLTYRNEIGKDFSYFVGAGTNLNLRAKQTLSFDFKRPSRDYGQETKERNIVFPAINNVNALVGLEKRWSPIVLQVSSFLNTRFKTFIFLDDRTDVGLQVKLLYEFNTSKKK